MRDAGTYVYAVGKGEAPSSFACSGVEGARSRKLRTVQSGELWAIVSDAPRGDVAVNRSNLRAHSDAVQEAVEHADALVPMQFGTVFPSDEAVRADLVDARANELHALLERVEHRVEMRLKAFYDETTVLREVVDENRTIRTLDRRTRSVSPEAGYYDRIRLGELIAAALAAKRARDAAAIVAALSPAAADVVVDEQVPGEWAVAAASFLVDRRRLDAFDAALRRLAAVCGDRVRLRCVGPLPPYSFVAVPLDLAAA